MNSSSSCCRALGLVERKCSWISVVFVLLLCRGLRGVMHTVHPSRLELCSALLASPKEVAAQKLLPFLASFCCILSSFLIDMLCCTCNSDPIVPLCFVLAFCVC